MSPEDTASGHSGRSPRPLLSNGVLLFCVLVLAALVLWQNVRLARMQAKSPPTGTAEPAPPVSSPASEQRAEVEKSPEAVRTAQAERPPEIKQPAQLERPAVVPAGDLAADEKATIQLFKAASPSVVHITTHVLQRDFFSLNVMETPEGTGTGFIWDDVPTGLM